MQVRERSEAEKSDGRCKRRLRAWLRALWGCVRHQEAVNLEDRCPDPAPCLTPSHTLTPLARPVAMYSCATASCSSTCRAGRHAGQCR
jgi:hypothetical protein